MSNMYRLPPEETTGQVWAMIHFPARFQFVIFRNWNRVPVERLAAVLETTSEQILLEASRMGLRRDSWVGFEASNHYLYGENELLEKYLNCKALNAKKESVIL